MAVHLPPFVQQLESRDPELYEAVKKVTEVAMTPGALDAKTKTLISLALDAYIGAERGVMVLARRQGPRRHRTGDQRDAAYFL